jgi:hypothetical protein
MAPGDGAVVVLVWVVAFGVEAAELECEGVLVVVAAVRVGWVELAGAGVEDLGFVFPGAAVVGAVLVAVGVVVLELDTVWPDAVSRVVAETNSGDAEMLVLALEAVAPLAELPPDEDELPDAEVPLCAEVSWSRAALRLCWAWSTASWAAVGSSVASNCPSRTCWPTWT